MDNVINGNNNCIFLIPQFFKIMISLFSINLSYVRIAVKNTANGKIIITKEGRTNNVNLKKLRKPAPS